MTSTLKKLSLTIFFITFLFTSCRKEEMELVQDPDDQVLVANSVLANLMQQTAMNDGSFDNIIDKANCFNIKLPIAVIANGIDISLNTKEDLSAIEYVFDTSDDDIDTVVLVFPITIVLNDFTEADINNVNEFNTHVNRCNGENESDSDIECLDFQYPIMASIFNTANELIDTKTMMNDIQLYGFLENIDQNDIVNLSFPIKVMLLDQTEININTLSELKNTIEIYTNTCDEDDDYDTNADDCDDCTKEELKTFLINCSNWAVDKLERNDYNYDNAYEGYEFNFYEDGTIHVYWSGTEAYGTWSTSGTGNNLTVVINIPDLTYCNNNWVLREIQSYSGETRIDFRLGDADRLRYIKNCN
jgi:hypothetical protein